MHAGHIQSMPQDASGMHANITLELSCIAVCILANKFLANKEAVSLVSALNLKNSQILTSIITIIGPVNAHTAPSSSDIQHLHVHCTVRVTI